MGFRGGVHPTGLSGEAPSVGEVFSQLCLFFTDEDLLRLGGWGGAGGGQLSHSGRNWESVRGSTGWHAAGWCAGFTVAPSILLPTPPRTPTQSSSLDPHCLVSSLLLRCVEVAGLPRGRGPWCCSRHLTPTTGGAGLQRPSLLVLRGLAWTHS